MLKAQNVGHHGSQISVIVVSYVLLHKDFEEKHSLQNEFHYHYVYLLYYFASLRNFHRKRKKQQQQQQTFQAP